MSWSQPLILSLCKAWGSPRLFSRNLPCPELYWLIPKHLCDLQHPNRLHPWNTLWLGKNTVSGWESDARRLTQKSRQKPHILKLLFPPERRNQATAGLGFCRDVETMLDFAGCSWLHFCTVFINCSIRKALVMFSNWRNTERLVLFSSLHPLHPQLDYDKV